MPSVAALAGDRTLPMRFDLRRQGPLDACGATCATWISATGAITADSGREFKQFMKDRDPRAVTVVLDSDGGSVLGAIDLGREIRKLALATTVGRTIDIGAKEDDRAVLSPRADCESMCAFVLLGGVQRIVPPEARVMVHQIWLGDRRQDPTAATYSAEDLVLVQRDIGRLAQYTAEMGASIDLLDLALRIPPWEPLHTMTRDEISRTRLATETIEIVPATVAATRPPSTSHPVQTVTDGTRVTRINERRWAMIKRDGAATLARRHPLTVEGDTIGSFDLALSCGDGTSYDLSYVEHRIAGAATPLPEKLAAVHLRVGRTDVALNVASSSRGHHADELVTYATGPVPASLIRTFASAGNHSMTIETRSDDTVTVIRLGNTGAQKDMPGLTAACAKPLGDRAEAVPVRKTGGLALAR